MPSSSSLLSRRPDNMNTINTTTRMRPPSDIPCTYPSSSRDSHPRNRQSQQQQQAHQSSSAAVSNSIHPHIRELVERQQKQQHREKQVYEQHLHHERMHRDHVRPEQLPMKEHTREHASGMSHRQFKDEDGGLGGGDDGNVIHGLHMDHVLNHQYHSSPRNQTTSPRNTNLPPRTIDATGDYVIEGRIQSKGCIYQTADDVGFLFGCGTHPQDEVVHVYITKPEEKNDPPAARADGRNLFYHRGPENTIVEGPMPMPGINMGNGMGVDTRRGNVGMWNSPRNDAVSEGGNNVDDVLFQIDREYQAMKAVLEENMGFNSTAAVNNMGGANLGSPNMLHTEFLQDPPPSSACVPPHGNYMVAHEDDAYTNTSCSISGLMDCILPGCILPRSWRDKHQQMRLPQRANSCSPRLSPRKVGLFDTSNNYPSNNRNDPQDPHFDERHYSTNFLCSTPRTRRRSSHNPVSSSHSDEDIDVGSTSSSFDKAKKNVVELQSQLNAMVLDRARRQKKTSNGSPPESPKEETRQEPTSPSSPPSNVSIDKVASEKKVQVELATHQRTMATMNAQYSQQQYFGNLCNPMGVASLSPTTMAMPATTMGMGVLPMLLSPLTADTAAVPIMPITNGINNSMNGMSNVMNNGMNNGMLGSNMNNGRMGNNNLGNNGMMGNTAMNNGTMNNVTMNYGMTNGVNNGMIGNDAKSGMMGSNGTMTNGMNNVTMANDMSNGMMVNTIMNNGMSNGIKNETKNNTMNNGNMNGGMMGNNNMIHGMDNSMNNGILGMHNGQGLQQQASQQQPTPPPPQDVDANSILQDANSILQRSIHIGGQTNDAMSVMSKPMLSGGGGGGRSEGKFIDNIGAYPLRALVGAPKTPSSARRSPPSQPNTLLRPDPSSREPPGARNHQQSSRPQARANMPSSSSIQSNSNEFAQRNQMLNDLKIKNALIRQDITRMKTCMGDTNKKNPPRGINAGMNGGVNVAAGMRVGPTKSSSRPFPRTPPSSSPSKQRYGFQDVDPIVQN